LGFANPSRNSRSLGLSEPLFCCIIRRYLTKTKMKTKRRQFIANAGTLLGLLTILGLCVLPVGNSPDYSAAVTNYILFPNMLEMTLPVECPTSAAKVVYNNTSNVLYADASSTPVYSSFLSFYNALKSEISANGGKAKCPYEFKLYTMGVDSSRTRLLSDGYAMQTYICRGAEIVAGLGGKEGSISCYKSMSNGGRISFSFWNDYTTGTFVGYTLYYLTSGNDYRIQDPVYGVKVSRLPANQ